MVQILYRKVQRLGKKFWVFTYRKFAPLVFRKLAPLFAAEKKILSSLCGVKGIVNLSYSEILICAKRAYEQLARTETVTVRSQSVYEF